MTGDTTRPFPWAAVLHFAFRVLRWPPDAVWRATPREIAAAMAPPGAEPMRAGDFAALLRAFPDTSHPTEPSWQIPTTPSGEITPHGNVSLKPWSA